jgi:hypothetical protein
MVKNAFILTRIWAGISFNGAEQDHEKKSKKSFKAYNKLLTQSCVKFLG